MRYVHFKEGVGRITKQNQTVDVGPNEISIQAAKFGNSVDKDGRPTSMPKKTKGSKTNVLFNLGLAESVDEKKLNNYKSFINFCCEELKVKSKPSVRLTSKELPETFGYYDIDENSITVSYANRHQMDVMRTIAHEIVHHLQRESKEDLDGSDGSIDENEANAIAGVVLRKWASRKPHLFSESVDNLYESVLYYRQMKENLGEIAQATEIYVDMDGVLADFFGEWSKLMNVDHFSKIDKQHDIKDALQKIRDTNEFWLKLPLLPQAKQLLAVIKQIKGKYNICSSPLADDPNSEPHKREWIKKNLNFFPPEKVIITHNKSEYATQQDGTPNILIDDFGKNVDSWEAAGGTAFKYKDHKFERTAKAIQQHMQEPVTEAFDTQIDWEKDPEDHGDVEAYIAYIGYKEVGIQYFFEPINAGGVVLPGLDITFEVNGATKKTGGGDASTIFGAVINHIKQFINQHKEIDVIQFSASKEQGLSRTRLYSAMVDKLSQGTDWINAKTISKADKSVENADMFKLVRRSAVNDKMVGIDENFADGKKKGKSRPGRVKRSGASCNGSVTELRAKAKKASGERAKMYHWCANMKSGRK